MVLAVALALLFGLRPWQEIDWSLRAVAVSLAATAPLAAILLLLPVPGWRWAENVMRIVRRVLHVLFANARPGAVVCVAVLAGVGEELLFRGVLQAGLSALWGPVVAIALASIVFGLAHAVTLAYLVIATVLGAYLGLLYHVTGNLLIPIVVHALYDWIAIRYYLRTSRADRADRLP